MAPMHEIQIGDPGSIRGSGRRVLALNLGATRGIAANSRATTPGMLTRPSCPVSRAPGQINNMSEGSSSSSAGGSSPSPFQLPGFNWMDRPDPRTPHTRAKIPIHQSLGHYPLIDIDPHAGRVIRYMRPSDWAGMAGMTLLAPFLFLSYSECAACERSEASDDTSMEQRAMNSGGGPQGAAIDAGWPGAMS